MAPFVVIISSIAGSPSEVESNISLLLEKTRSETENVSSSKTVQFKTIITDSHLQSVKSIFPEDGWALLEDTRKNLDGSHQAGKNCGTPSDKEVLLAEYLHVVADSLPYTGAILRVILFDNIDYTCDEGQSDHFIPLAGALRRLKEWHNGQIVLVNKTKKLPISREDLVDLGHCRIVHSVEQLAFKLPSWEGKIAVVDRIENKGPTFTGHCLESDTWEALLQDKVHTCTNNAPKLNSLRKRQRLSPELPPILPVCGRTIEILQEVDLRTFPSLLVDSWALSLNVQEGHSDILMKYIHELLQAGLLARLRVYPDSRHIPCCGRTNSLNTEAWKKRILGNSWDEPPEKPVANDVFYLHFLLLGPVSPEFLPSATVQVVLSPREINKNVINLVTKQTTNECHSFKLNQADLKMDIHVLQSEAFANLLKLLQEHKKNTVSEIHDRTKGLCKSDAEKTYRKVMEEATQVQEKLLTLAFQDQPTLTKFMQQESISDPAKSFHWITESSLNYENFPEKMALQAKIAKRTELHSYPSQESLLSSSPMSVVETEKKRCTTDFAIGDILQMFNKDGFPIAPPFTPEKVEGRNLCRVDSTPDLNTQWPNSQSLQYHDIYYYMDENDLGLEKKYSKIRDKVLEQDTLSTFVTPIKKRPQKLPTISPIRSSPRRRNSAQHLMTRSRSDSVQSNHSPGPFQQSFRKDVFKQPSLHSPPSRRLSAHMITPGNNLSSSQSQSGGKTAASSSHSLLSQPVSHSTPLSSLPTRISPRKKVLKRSFSSVSVKTLPPVITSKNSSYRQVSQNKQCGPSLSQTALHRSMSETHTQHSIPATQSMSDPPVRRSPRKSTATVWNTSKYKEHQRSEDGESISQTWDSNRSLPNKSNVGFSRTASITDMDEISQQSQPELQQSKLKRSDRHKMDLSPLAKMREKLKNIIKCVLEEKGVKEIDTIYTACFKNLFNVSLVLLKTLTSSQNLTEEMKNVVYTQVQQVQY